MSTETPFARKQLEQAGLGESIREPRRLGAVADVTSLCRAALDAPVDVEAIERLAGGGTVAIVVSDATRDEPRAELVDALLERLPRAASRLVVASGTHAGDDSVVAARHRDLPVVVHDARRAEDCVDCGVTRRGTRVRIARALVDADLVVVTGRIRPHYFAGYSGGVKGVFPGCALAEDALANHLLKAQPGARLGVVDGNPCREDMEEAALLLPTPLVALNVLADCDGNPRAAAFGHPVAAHRRLCGEAAEVFGLEAPRSAVVVVADRPPVSHSLYQASKMLPPAGPLLEPGGVVIVVAECDGGAGPRERVNDGIYRLGVRPQLPEEHRVLLVSRLSVEEGLRTYAEPRASLLEAVDDARRQTGHRGEIPVIWRAGECITRPLTSTGR